MVCRQNHTVDRACYLTKAAVQLFDGRAGDLYQGHIIGLEEFDRIVSSYKKRCVDMARIDEIQASIRYYHAYMQNLHQKSSH